jgi:xanthine dehydrogenase YagS FAD-binding subunit
MKAFRYERPATVRAALAAIAGGDALVKAAGIDVLDRMKERVDTPARVVTLSDLPGLDRIWRGPTGSLRIGALATLARIAGSDDVREVAPVLAAAAADAASPQVRNRATLGGNLGQHTRCGYYRIASFPCFKRGDAFCPVRAAGAVQENAGIFGNDLCACAHPSTLAPALGVTAAALVVAGPQEEFRMPLDAIYGPPTQGRTSDLALPPGHLILGVEIQPPGSMEERQGFHSIRQRAKFDWALVTAAAWLQVSDGRITDARLWLGAVAPTPLHALEASMGLMGAPASGEGFVAAARAAGAKIASAATPLPGTTYKADLVRVAVERALTSAKAVGRR